MPTSSAETMSSFGWLDADAAQRRRMLEVIDLFQEPGTVDELGIGAVRDALSDMLFPGTSVLHTRLRYVLFVPWLLHHASGRGGTPAEMREHFRTSEYQLIRSLQAGGERSGVFGRYAGGRLKNLPSSAYWSALTTWQLVRADSPDDYFRLTNNQRALQRRTLTSDNPESRGWMPPPVADPNIPNPPARLQTSTTFTLTPLESSYLSDRIAEATAGTALAWLCQHPPAELPGQLWNLDTLSEAPPQIQNQIDHAKRFSLAIHGASILYNLLLSEKSERPEHIDRYRGLLNSWAIEIAATGVLDGWDRGDWWATILHQNPRVSGGAQRFVNRWLDLITDRTDVAGNSAARTLVRDREVAIKGGRARLTNQAALDAWRGDSGMSSLSFRWGVARSHLQDLADGRSAA